MKKALLFIVNLYQRHVSPATPPSCRYIPTCSEYAKQAIEKHGAAKGSYLAARRILRCHPFSRRDPYDPVP